MTRDARPMNEEDLPQVLDLLRVTLNWPAGEHGDQLWRWKHRDSPFGQSVVWVGTESNRVVSVRPFMRWRFADGSGTAWEAVRAVDTATHPEHQGQGWLRRLTAHGITDLEHIGIRFVFNTPNQQSGPAYIRLGWHDLKRPTVWVRPAGVQSLIPMLHSRTAADLAPLECGLGMTVDEALGRPEVLALLGSLSGPRRHALATVRSETYVRWRYGRPDQQYRMVSAGKHGQVDSVAVIRSRRRGPSVERSVLEVIGGSGAVRDACSRDQRFDYAIAIGKRPGRFWWRLPFGAPRLVFRPVVDPVTSIGLDLSLGDLEGF